MRAPSVANRLRAWLGHALGERRLSVRAWCGLPFQPEDVPFQPAPRGSARALEVGGSCCTTRADAISSSRRAVRTSYVGVSFCRAPFDVGNRVVDALSGGADRWHIRTARRARRHLVQSLMNAVAHPRKVPCWCNT